MSAEGSITLSSALTQLKGVGDKTAALFRSVGMETVADLLRCYPRSYDEMPRRVKAGALAPGQIQAVCLTILGSGRTVRAGSRRITCFRASDETGEVRLTYYNMPYLVRTVRSGSVHVFRGPVRQYRGGILQIDQASIYFPEEYDRVENTLQPRYHLTKGLKNAQISRLAARALDSCTLPPDYLSEESRRRLGLMEIGDAVREIHFPENASAMSAARDRLVFDEFCAFVNGIRRHAAREGAVRCDKPLMETADTVRLIERLPFRLTPSQEKAWQEIRDDLCGDTVMNRLLQGDVGSGKTILAFLALTLCAANGRQGLLMAPTEVLARQHMRDLTELAERYRLPVRPVLLTGSVTGKNRSSTCAAIMNGTANVVIGTHALFQDKVVYRDVALVITDEQHRFGVRQREALAGRGEKAHVLVMSATPIPRTLSIILYGDLQVSRLTDMPPGRSAIRNLAAPSSERGKIYAFILRQIREGHQAYVVCPAVEESSAEGMQALQNVTDYTAALRASLPPSVRIEALNGRMKPAEKDRIMTAFARHDIDILVSTTVIEVGINVPNATCMLVENAERFGLSQLHQLRGRVGRGQWQSYCIFLYSDAIKEKPERLSVLEKTSSGFEIAEQDLRLRGPGDLFGIRQSGEMGFCLADIYEDAALLSRAAAYVGSGLSDEVSASPWLPDLTMRGI